MSGKATYTAPRIEIGALNRRHFRALINEMRVAGLDIELHEVKGLLDSIYSVRIAGTDAQILRVAAAFKRFERTYG